MTDPLRNGDVPMADVPLADVPMADVLVAGGGIAAVCAAIAARRSGASVAMAEWAPKPMRGGNARHSRNFRIMHEAPTPLVRGRYDAGEYWSDLHRATNGDTDEALAHPFIRESAGIVDWLAEQGARFQGTADGLLPWSRKTAFFLGGGKALMNALYATAERLGVAILYDAEVHGLDVRGGRVHAAAIRHAGRERVAGARAVVVATGGFQADLSALRDHWGEAADGFVVRGTPYATGTLLRDLLAHGALPAGDPARCHMVAVDGRSPAFDGGIVTRLDGLSWGIVVDRDGRRFHDEGADTGPTRYAAWGERVARCPGHIAWSVFDAAIERRFIPSIFPAIRAGSVAGLATELGMPPGVLESTVGAFNAAIREADGPAGGDGGGDGGRTEGLEPAKSRRALPLLTPPFGAYPMRAGITSTYLGVRIDGTARVLTGDGALENLFAAGVIMAPNIVGRGYLAGIAMTIGAVFGRIAGREAARCARS